MDIREKFRELTEVPDFEDSIADKSVMETADSMEVMQINVGRRCNLACKHCHVEAGPNRTEVMSREVMEACLKVYQEQGFSTIDITGFPLVCDGGGEDLSACYCEDESGYYAGGRLPGSAAVLC